MELYLRIGNLRLNIIGLFVENYLAKYSLF